MAQLNDFTPEELAEMQAKGIDPSTVQIVDSGKPTDNGIIGKGSTIANVLKAHAGGIGGGGLGAIGGGALVGALAGSEVPVIGNIVGGVLGGLAGGYGGQRLQQAVESPDTYEQQQELAAESARQNPITAGATDIGASALASGGMFSPTTAVKGISGIGRGLIGKGLNDEAKNVLIQSALNPAIGTGVSLAQGEGIPSASELGQQALGGALFAKSWLPHGRLASEPQQEVNAIDTTPVDTLDSEPTITSTTPYTSKDEEGAYKLGNKSVKSIFLKQFTQTIPSNADDITKGYIRTANDKLRSMSVDDMRNALHQSELSKANSVPAGGEIGSGGINEWGEPNEEINNGVIRPQATAQDILGISQAAIKPVVEPTVPKPEVTANAKDFQAAKNEELANEGVGSQVAMKEVAPKVNPIVEEVKAKATENRQDNTQPNDNAEQIEEQFNRTGNVNSPLSDYNRYQELTNQLKGKNLDEAQPIAQEIESIKNKYGGNPPPRFPENHVLTPIALQAHIINNRATTGSILHSLANTPDHPFQPLAKALLDSADTKSLGVRWNHNSQLDTPNNLRSHYDPYEDVVRIGSGASGDSRVVMEEAIHSLTSKKIPNFKEVGAKHLEELDKYLKNGKNKSIKDLINSYKETSNALGINKDLSSGAANNPELSSKIIQTSGKGHTGYAMGNLHEFIAQAMKDPGFQRTLEGIQTNDERTVWQKIVNAVRNLLGLSPKEGSMLDRVLRSSGELVAQERPDTSFREIRYDKDGNVTSDRKIHSPPKKDSKSPTELKLPPDKYMGKFGTIFRSVLDKVRDIGKPAAIKLADHMQMAVDKETELKGQWKNSIIQGGEHLTAFDKKRLMDTFNQELATKQLHPQMLTNNAQRSFYRLARAKLDESGKYRLAIGEPVMEVTKSGYIPRNIKQIESYFPGMANNKVEQIYRSNTDDKAVEQLDKEFNEYNTKTLGMTPDMSAERISNFKTALQGTSKNRNVTQQEYFNAHRKEMGTPLPPSFREQDPVKNLSRYFDRAAVDASHYQFLEKDHDVLSSLGQTKDAWGNDISKSDSGSLANNPAVKSALEHWQGHVHNPADVNESSLSSLLSSAYIAGPALEVHKAVSNIVKSIAQTSNPIVITNAITHGIMNINKGYQHAVENGAVKLSANSALGMMNGSYTAAERMQSLATAIRKASTLGDLTTKVGTGLVQSINETIIPSKVLRANAGDKSSQLFIKRLDPTYQVGKQYSPQEVQQLASRSANYIHGTGDIRSLPAWMLNDSEFSGFFSLAHWSVAQTNNFMKEVYEPALRGDIKPLLISALGSVAGGYIIKELREDIQGKKNPIPSLQEIASSDKGLEGNKGLVAYNMIAAMQYSGFGGLLSQIAKYPFDFSYKNNPQGATFPLDEVTSDIAKTLHQVGEAVANDPNVNWVDLAKTVTMHTLSNDFQLGRIAINQGINSGLITGLPAEKKMLADRMGQLRRFDMVDGLPYNDIDEAGNLYMNIEQKKFKGEQDINEAMKQLPSLVDNIFKTYGDRPEVLMGKLKALKENQYATFPSISDAPMAFFKYLSYLTRNEGAAKAQEELAAYMQYRTTNQIKSSVVP